MRSTSSSFLRWSGGHHLINGGSRTFPYGFPRNMSSITEVKLVSYFYSLSEKRPTQLFLEKIEPFHGRQAATSFPAEQALLPSNISKESRNWFSKVEKQCRKHLKNYRHCFYTKILQAMTVRSLWAQFKLLRTLHELWGRGSPAWPCFKWVLRKHNVQTWSNMILWNLNWRIT